MITTDQAKEFLASVGIELPDFMLELLVEQANSIEPCLVGAGYSVAVSTLIQLYLIGLLGTVQGDRYVTQQRAPSGASQSYRYGTLSERYSSLYSLLGGLDTSGCADALIPADPTANHAAMFVGIGGCL